MGFFERALREIDQADFETVEDEEVLLLLLFKSFLLARLGRVDEAVANLSQIGQVSKYRFDETARLEFTYCTAYIAYCRGEHQLARKNLGIILRRTESISADNRRFAFQQDAYAIRSKAATLLGVLAATSDQFLEMERWHCEALLSAEKARPRDAFLECVILGNLSCAVGEVYCPTSVSLLQERLESMNWTSGMAEQRLYVERNLVRARRLFGVGKFRLSPSSVSSPSLAWRLGESVDRLLMDDWPCVERYVEELTFAKSLVARVDWMSTVGEEDTNLDELAVLLAPFDTDAAADAQTTLEIKLNVSLPHYPTGRTSRDRAAKSFALACVAKSRGDFVSAEREFLLALHGLGPSGITWRLAILGVELFTLKRDQSLLEVARAFVSEYPAGAFTRRMRRALEIAESGADAGTFPYLRDALLFQQS
jgi:hypothetical protein